MLCIFFAIVAKFADEQIRPYVIEMDQNAEMRAEIIQGLFDLGVCIHLTYEILSSFTLLHEV